MTVNIKSSEKVCPVCLRWDCVCFIKPRPSTTGAFMIHWPPITK